MNIVVSVQKKRVILLKFSFGDVAATQKGYTCKHMEEQELMLKTLKMTIVFVQDNGSWSIYLDIKIL